MKRWLFFGKMSGVSSATNNKRRSLDTNSQSAQVYAVTSSEQIYAGYSLFVYQSKFASSHFSTVLNQPRTPSADLRRDGDNRGRARLRAAGNT